MENHDRMSSKLLFDIFSHPSFHEKLFSQLIEYYINGRGQYKEYRIDRINKDENYYIFSNSGRINNLVNSNGNKLTIHSVYNFPDSGPYYFDFASMAFTVILNLKHNVTTSKDLFSYVSQLVSDDNKWFTIKVADLFKHEYFINFFKSALQNYFNKIFKKRVEILNMIDNEAQDDILKGII